MTQCCIFRKADDRLYALYQEVAWEDGVLLATGDEYTNVEEDYGDTTYGREQLLRLSAEHPPTPADHDTISVLDGEELIGVIHDAFPCSCWLCGRTDGVLIPVSIEGEPDAVMCKSCHHIAHHEPHPPHFCQIVIHVFPINEVHS